MLIHDVVERPLGLASECWSMFSGHRFMLSLANLGTDNYKYYNHLQPIIRPLFG